MRKLLVLVGLATCLFLADKAWAYEGENCPSDWHKPPCGDPGPVVRPPKLTALRKAEQLHWEMTALMGIIATATCKGNSGVPGLDKFRGAACVAAGFVGAVTLTSQQWESRLIQQILEAAGTNRLMVEVPLSVSSSFSVGIDTGGDQYLDALVAHGEAIEWLWAQISESIRQTVVCDQWAQYDVDGIRCGNFYRELTEMYFDWLGEKYAAVAAITAYLASQMEPTSDEDWGIVHGFYVTASDENQIAWEFINL